MPVPTSQRSEANAFSPPAAAGPRAGATIVWEKPAPRLPDPRRQRAERKRREKQWLNAASGAERAGWPLNTAIHFTWHALMTAGERLPGNVLHHPECERVGIVWRRLRHHLKDHGEPFLAARAPERSGEKGPHLHLALHWPRPYEELVVLVETLTGAPREYLREPESPAWERSPTKDRKRGYVARSDCGGWLVQTNVRPGEGGSEGLLGYLSKSARTDRDQPQFRLSDALSDLARSEAL